MSEEKGFLGKLFSGKKKCCCKFEIVEDEPQKTENEQPAAEDKNRLSKKPCGFSTKLNS